MTLTLASGSPRRRLLLGQLGYALRVAPADIDETPRPGEGPVDFALRMAREKAAAGAHPGLVLAADTVVHLDGHILGKPADAAEARAMLRMLSGRAHEVTTGVCVQDGDRRWVDAVTTEVTFRPLSEAEVSGYVATGEPFDKAGGYGIQGIGGFLVSHIRGSYTNVVGLPLAEVLDALADFGLPGPFASPEPP
ncbi:MAG: septum formation inhibitor Maf [Alphaproteobacteria bacterium]|nr:septum formation inhibitor Maf [Alphaproteobacteria bacterium]